MVDIGLLKVELLLEGYGYVDIENRYRVSGICILIMGNGKKIFVDIGSLCDKKCFIEKLNGYGIFVEDINYVVCIYGYVDYVGNLNFFINVFYMVFYDVLYDKDIYGDLFKDFNEGVFFCIEGENIQVISILGYILEDVSVVVKGID